MTAGVFQSCLLCGGTDSSTLCEFPELTWVTCRCGLIYKRFEAVSTVEYDEDYFEVRRQYNRRNRRRIQKSRSQILDVLNHVQTAPSRS